MTEVERAREIAASFLDPTIAPDTIEALKAGRMDNHVWVRVALAALTGGVTQADVTPAALDAGVAAYFDWNHEEDEPRIIVKDIFESMLRVSQDGGSKPA